MDGLLGGIIQLRPGQSERPTESKSVPLILPVYVRNIQTTPFFVLSEHGCLEDLLMDNFLGGTS